MDQVDLKEKFPNLRPMSGAPILFRLNGCGLSIYGRRDEDRETKTYVKTYCLCFVFIPVIPICAYRVADAGNGGWYFIGKEPLSGLARIYNYFLLSAILVMCGVSAYRAHMDSPEHKASVMLAEAEELEAGGKLLPAAQKYSNVFVMHTSQSQAAAEKVIKLAKDQFSKLPTADEVTMLNMMPMVGPSPDAKKALNDLALARINELLESDPRAALPLLEATRLISTDMAAQKKLRETILEKIVAKSPEDTGAASELALLYESRKQFDKCEAVLAPCAKKLGSSEGARILGSIYAGAGKIEDAFTLLSPYCEARLKKLHAAETACNNSMQNAWNQNLNILKNGQGPHSFYNEIDHMTADRRDARIQEYLNDQIKRDGNVKAAQDALTKEAAVVPVALDLGIVRLRRAQSMSDPAARKQELEAAEKLFLAIRGIAGETDEYKLFFGQICYWLGKQAEGKKAFDDLLTAKNRSTAILAQVATLMNELGAGTETRALMEEAYGKETDARKKSNFACERSTVAIDIDDKIKWLRLADAKNPEVEASLNEALGWQAMREGNKAKAETYLRQSFAGYQKMAKTSVTLNNGALAALGIYGATRERKDFQLGLDMLTEASGLAPSDSILLNNLTQEILNDAVLGTIGSEIDLKTLDISPDMDLLSHLYKDTASHDAIVKRFMEQPGYARAMTNLERLLVIAPRNATIYHMFLDVLSFTRDTKKFAELLERAKNVELDQEGNRQRLEAYAGKKDAQSLADLQPVIKKFEKIVASNPADKRTESAACGFLSSCLIEMHSVGGTVDADRVVTLAERGYTSDLSQNSRGRFMGALFFRAELAVAKQDAAFAELDKKFSHALGSFYLIAFAAAQGGKTREVILQNPDIKRALELLKEDGKAMPSHRGSWEWALFSAADPAEAQAVVEQLKAHSASLRISLRLAVNPVDAGEAMEAYFERLAAGDEAGGRKILQDAAKLGVPVPQK